MSKFVEVNDKIAKVVVKGYKKIENGVVSGYTAMQDGIVKGASKCMDTCTKALFAKEGETLEETKARLTNINRESDEQIRKQIL